MCPTELCPHCGRNWKCTVELPSLMDYFRENFGKSKGFVLSDLLMHPGGDCWALNAI
jgi:hypothetical protein